MQSIFTKAVDKGTYENVVGVHWYKREINSSPVGMHSNNS